MQNIAMEMNLSETAFLYKQNDGFDLRWFTPEAEVDLCGHATLASAHILWETGVLKNDDEAVFITKSGKLTAKKEDENIILDFPAERALPVSPIKELVDSIGVPVLYFGKNRMDYIVELENEEVVRNLKPDLEKMKIVVPRGIIVTSRSTNPDYDFVSRFFAPGIGINEDPVTGSAHCCLGPYWQERLGKNELTGYQASKRGGVLKVECCDDRVFLKGQAVTVFSAKLSDE
jgi:PhzF family phenazine biosynthesis protein